MCPFTVRVCGVSNSATAKMENVHDSGRLFLIVSFTLGFVISISTPESFIFVFCGLPKRKNWPELVGLDMITLASIEQVLQFDIK
jgi:hypothetical protein